MKMSKYYLVAVHHYQEPAFAIGRNDRPRRSVYNVVLSGEFNLSQFINHGLLNSGKTHFHIQSLVEIDESTYKANRGVVNIPADLAGIWLPHPDKVFQGGFAGVLEPDGKQGKHGPNDTGGEDAGGMV